jgi:hypothetical protein
MALPVLQTYGNGSDEDHHLRIASVGTYGVGSRVDDSDSCWCWRTFVWKCPVTDKNGKDGKHCDAFEMQK